MYSIKHISQYWAYQLVDYEYINPLYPIFLHYKEKVKKLFHFDINSNVQTTRMRKSLLLFFLLIFAIVLWKVTEATEDKLNDTAVEELVSETSESTIANK